MDKITGTLVCFAVKEEARYFIPSSVPGERIMLLTGMGRKNAAAKVQAVLETIRPELVITAGFAGGLNPKLKFGTIVFEADAETGLSERLQKAGALPAKFFCAERVAVTAADKAVLWKSTSADAVEMESSVIRALCRERNIPSATVRVISDAADENLPLDFNALMTPDDRINYFKLAWAVACSPKKIRALIRFEKQTQMAAQKLAVALNQSLS